MPNHPTAPGSALDIQTLNYFQARLYSICPDHFGLRWVTEPGRLCFYATRDLAIPYDDFVSNVDIVAVEEHVHTRGHASIRRLETGHDEHRVWTYPSAPHRPEGQLADQGYLAVRRRPDGGVRIARLCLRELTASQAGSSAGWHAGPWLKTRWSVCAFRRTFRRTIGLIEGTYVGPDLRLTH